jgi:hypothetical protein
MTMTLIFRRRTEIFISLDENGSAFPELLEFMYTRRRAFWITMIAVSARILSPIILRKMLSPRSSLRRIP